MDGVLVPMSGGGSTASIMCKRVEGLLNISFVQILNTKTMHKGTCGIFSAAECGAITSYTEAVQQCAAD